MKTEAGVREQMLAVLQENPGDEFRPQELTSAVNVDLEGAGLPELAQILAPEIEAGRIVCRKAGRGTFYSAPLQDDPPPVVQRCPVGRRRPGAGGRGAQSGRPQHHARARQGAFAVPPAARPGA